MSSKRLNLAYALAAIGLIVAVGLLINWQATKNKTSKAEGMLILSNGKVAYIGETQATLESSLKGNLQKVASGFNYVSQGKTEVAFFLKSGEVSAIRTTANSLNRHVPTGIGITTKTSNIQNRVGKYLQPLNAAQNLTGYKYAATTVVGFFLTDPCASSQSVIAMVLARSGEENLALPQTTKIESCGASS